MNLEKKNTARCCQKTTVPRRLRRRGFAIKNKNNNARSSGVLATTFSFLLKSSTFFLSELETTTSPISACYSSLLQWTKNHSGALSTWLIVLCLNTGTSSPSPIKRYYRWGVVDRNCELWLDITLATLNCTFFLYGLFLSLNKVCLVSILKARRRGHRVIPGNTAIKFRGRICLS